MGLIKLAPNNKKSKKNASASVEQKGEKPEAKPQNLTSAGNAQRSKDDKQKRRKETDKMASILNGAESKALNDVIYNLLEAEKPQQLVRPVPVRSVEGHYAGQIRFDTNDEYVEVRVRPDPKSFCEITTQTTSPVSSIPTEEVGNIYSGPGGANSAAKRYVCFQEPVILQDGTFVRPTPAESANTVGIMESFYNDQVLAIATGWHGLQLANGAVLTINVINNGGSNASVEIQLFKVNTVSRAQTLLQVGPTVIAAANAAATATITATVAYAIAQDEILVVAIGVLASVAGSFVRFRDLTFTPTIFSGITATDVYSTTNYTIGQAVYGKSDDRATVLDAFFTEALLWAPVSLSSRLNVRQQVNTAGGLMLAAYLPSFVMSQTSTTPSRAWEDIVAYKRSYPVKDSLPFRTGAHASWVGMRLQDYEFRGQFSQPSYLRRDAESLPLNVFIAQKASTDPVRYYFDFQVNFELQSVNPLVTAKPGPCSPDFLAQFLAMCACHELLVGENPSHIERLKKLVKKITSDPRVRSAAKFALVEGVPFLLRHL